MTTEPAVPGQSVCSECGTPASARRCERPRSRLSAERLIPVLLALASAAVIFSHVEPTGGRFDWADPQYFVLGGVFEGEIAETLAGERPPPPLRAALLHLASHGRPDRDPSAVLMADMSLFAGWSTRSRPWAVGWPLPWLTRDRWESQQSFRPPNQPPLPRWQLTSAGLLWRSIDGNRGSTIHLDFGALLLSAWLAAAAAAVARWIIVRCAGRNRRERRSWARVGAACALLVSAGAVTFLPRPWERDRSLWPATASRPRHPTWITLDHIRRMPDGPASDMAILSEIAAAVPGGIRSGEDADRSPLRLTVGFADAATSTWSIVAVGRPLPVFLYSTSDKGAPVGVPPSPAMRPHLAMRGPFLEFNTGVCAWPGRTRTLAIQLGALAYAAALIALAYAIPRSLLAAHRALRTRRRLRRALCVACGYPKMPAVSPA